MRDIVKVYNTLESIVLDATMDWDFSDWYCDGIDPYLAREVIYLCLQWNDPEKTNISFDQYEDNMMAQMAWDYARVMDDFTRFWNNDSGKLEVLMECKEWLDEHGLKPEVKNEQVHS